MNMNHSHPFVHHLLKRRDLYIFSFLKDPKSSYITNSSTYIMGTLHIEPRLTHDLKVTMKRSSKVFPSKKSERKLMFLSNIDQVLNFYVETVHFFEANREFPHELVIERLENAISKVLAVYDFLAGRLRIGGEDGRLELDCNCGGVGFAVASSEVCLAEIGDLVFPNPSFRQLVVGDLEKFSVEDRPLCAFQVTSFKCGGFALGISCNHVTFDGIGFRSFLDNLAAIASNKPLCTTPCSDRRLLSARSPPQVTFPHPELLPFQSHHDLASSIFHDTQEKLHFKLFQLSPHHILNLKHKAKLGNSNNRNINITSFNVVTALIWRCKALSSEDLKNKKEKISRVLYAVDIRSRLEPPLPISYVGNAVISAYASASLGELEDGPFSLLVERLFEGATRITNEYARSVIDWGETHKGLPCGDLLVSSWWRLGFAEVEYPWGRPRYSSPIVAHKKDIVLFFPDIEGVVGKGVNVLVALPSEDMEKFQTFFHKFLY